MLQSTRGLAGLLITAVLVTENAAQTTLSGYESDAVALPASMGAAIGGLEVLPNGNYALYDGSAVIEIDPVSHGLVRTLLTPPMGTFGAFLVLGPGDQFLYFGDGTGGDVVEIDLASATPRVVTNALYPFDLAFDATGRCFLSWAPVIGGGSRVSHVDLATGVLDDVLTTVDPSGPIVFTASGDLYAATPELGWPPPIQATEVLHFTKAQVDGAIGASLLTVTDGSLRAMLDGAYGFALDDGGDLFVTDGYYHKVVELDAAGGAPRTVWDSVDTQGLTYVRFVPPGLGTFEWYQPAGSGELLMVDTNYFSFNDLRRLRPARPVLSTTPAGPLPVGPYQFDLTGGVPGGVVLMFVTGGVLNSELPLRNKQWPAPLFLGLDFSAGLFLSQVLPLDGNGEFTTMQSNPGLSGLTIGVQGFVGASPSGPYYGSTTPLELVYQ